MRWLVLSFLFSLTQKPLERGQLPKLFVSGRLSCDAFADAVNHYVALGKDKTLDEFKAIDREVGKASYLASDADDRMGWVCRVLWIPKSTQPLREPRFGALSLPFMSMPLERWPLYPVCQSGATYFILSEGYFGAGRPEPISKYYSYCAEHGTFRKDPVHVPVKSEAIRDAENLHSSELWKSIRWKYYTPDLSYEFSETGSWAFIHRQAEMTREAK
jgi:hypothetical protein